MSAGLCLDSACLYPIKKKKPADGDDKDLAYVKMYEMEKVRLKEIDVKHGDDADEI